MFRTHRSFLPAFHHHSGAQLGSDFISLSSVWGSRAQERVPNLGPVPRDPQGPYRLVATFSKIKVPYWALDSY